MGCTGRGPVLPAAGPTEPAAVELAGTPFHPQTEYQCGPAALATVLGAAGVAVSPAALADQVYVPARRGSLQIELKAASRRQGVIPYTIRPRLEDLLAQVQAGRPVLVLQNLAFPFWPRWHYAVVVGLDRAQDTLILRSGKTRRLVTPAHRFERTWRWAESWGLVLLRPGDLPADPDAGAYLSAVADSEGRLPAGDLHAAYAAAARRWPADPVAWFGVGNAAYALGDLEQAESGYRQVLELAPGDPLARNNLAQVLAATGRLELARREIERALAEAAPGTAVYNELSKTRAEILTKAGS
ncbi:MAG TPA: PA2778 family cysteine peptidase [Gammaproteobacteria bacterium]|nr:PA2778 family cysteine peptidase [Gammaproteobacteria bacterium]